jgi:uncharacterized Zn finger protein (UPF0148 family)
MLPRVLGPTSENCPRCGSALYVITASDLSYCPVCGWDEIKDETP